VLSAGLAASGRGAVLATAADSLFRPPYTARPAERQPAGSKAVLALAIAHGV
jgi:hypothetical protein